MSQTKLEKPPRGLQRVLEAPPHPDLHPQPVVLMVLAANELLVQRPQRRATRDFLGLGTGHDGAEPSLAGRIKREELLEERTNSGQRTVPSDRRSRRHGLQPTQIWQGLNPAPRAAVQHGRTTWLSPARR